MLGSPRAVQYMQVLNRQQSSLPTIHLLRSQHVHQYTKSSLLVPMLFLACLSTLRAARWLQQA